ncbi:MAG: NgoFVII family restriction endonuclease [Chloroflexi bacterium]|nr:NgoFVII family restriction endonuclease [Chloroflexota bacterium]
MTTQQGFTFDDPDSRTRSGTLNVVYAQANSVSAFDRSLFADFDSMKALTYTSSIPMILGLLKDFDYDSFECIFGHNGVLTRSAADLLAFQSVVDESLNKGFVGIAGLSEERRRIIYDRAASGAAQFYVVKDAIAHAKIYLLEKDGLRRVIVGSANLSEVAFSGRQAETLIVFDNDDMAWRHYSQQYEAVLSVATSKLSVREKPILAELMPIEETPLLKEAESSESGISMYIPASQEDEAEYGMPQILEKVERIKPVRQKALADIRPDRSGSVRFIPRIVRQMTRIATSVGDEGAPATYLSYDGRQFMLSGNEMNLDVVPDEVRSDAAAWLEFFSNYENGFVGDVPRLQKDYFTFMSWFYFSPLMCDIRNKAIRNGNFSFDQPMFAVVYGQSNCGKSSLIETLMKSMFSYPRIVETQSFTRGNLRGLQQAYKRFPVVFDDVTRDRFNRHAPEIIKDENIRDSEYPCFALSMSWFYFSPLMCDIRNKAIRNGNFSFDQPMFAVVYGQSNCGKSSLIETLMKSMFSYPRIVETQSFTRGNLRGLQQAYKRFPVVFDDVTRDRFNRHAPEIIKDENIRDSEYPCFALSMNADARNFPSEIVKRSLMIYTRTSLPGDDTAARRRLQRSVANIRERLGTALYREYLKRVLSEIASLSDKDYNEIDVLHLSSAALCDVFRDNLSNGEEMPQWCAPMTLEDYQKRAFERPRLVLENLLHPDKYSKERRPPVGGWNISGELVIVAVEPMTASRTRNDIPDWILEETASVSDQIAMKRDLLEDFLNRPVKSPRKWLPFFS